MAIRTETRMSDRENMSEGEIAQERLQAIRVRDALHRLIKKLAQGEPATPSELSVWLRKSGHEVSCLFLWMACTAVAEKYQKAGKQDVAEKLLALRSACEQFRLQQKPAWSDREYVHGHARPLQGLARRWKRISQHQSRLICPDLDIALCSGAAFSLGLGLTPWVCQQPDLRYRWTDDGMSRLGYLADCWDAYAKKELTWADRTIGLPDFPLYPDYC